MPGAEVVRVDSDIHGARGRKFGKAPVRVAVQVPGSARRVIPDTQGVMTEHNAVAIHGDFRELVEPKEFRGELANLFIMIAGNREDSLAADLVAELRRSRLRSHAEITKEIKDVVRFDVLVEPVEDGPVHLLDV